MRSTVASQAQHHHQARTPAHSNETKKKSSMDLYHSKTWLINLIGRKERRCVPSLLLSKHESFCAIQSGGTNQTRFTFSKMRYWQTAGLDRTCVALERAPILVSSTLNVSVRCTSSNAGNSNSPGLKSTVFFTAPKQAKRVTKKLFPVSGQDRSCWNCGWTGHRQVSKER